MSIFVAFTVTLLHIVCFGVKQTQYYDESAQRKNVIKIFYYSLFSLLLSGISISSMALINSDFCWNFLLLHPLYAFFPPVFTYISVFQYDLFVHPLPLCHVCFLCCRVPTLPSSLFVVVHVSCCIFVRFSKLYGHRYALMYMNI